VEGVPGETPAEGGKEIAMKRGEKRGGALLQTRKKRRGKALHTGEQKRETRRTAGESTGEKKGLGKKEREKCSVRYYLTEREGENRPRWREKKGRLVVRDRGESKRDVGHSAERNY